MDRAFDMNKQLLDLSLDDKLKAPYPESIKFLFSLSALRNFTYYYN